MPTPIKKPVNSVTSVAVEPTAPSAVDPANWPTTAMSDILNSTCTTFETISGTLNRKICRPSGPRVISKAVCFIFFKLIPAKISNNL